MLPEISSEFKKSNEASWVGTAYVLLNTFTSNYSNTLPSYLLATCTFTPLYGRLCDVMGRQGANHSAVLFASIGILACGLSKSMEMLIISRFVSLFRILIGSSRFYLSPLQISGMGGGGIFTTAS